MRRAAPVAAVALCAALLAGCAPATPRTPTPSAAALVGRWSSTDGGSLVLAADRTCTARLISVGIDIVSGRCTWSIGPRAASDGAPTVPLDFSADASAHFATATFEVAGSGGSTTLRHDDGRGQDSFYVLHR